MSLIMIPIIFVVILYNNVAGEHSSTPTTVPLPPVDTNEIEILVPQPPETPASGGSTAQVDGNGFLTLDHDGVMVATPFRRSWTVVNDGRQKILTSRDRSVICQSLVIPRGEFEDMVSSNGGIRQAVENIVRFGISQALPPGARVDISPTELFKEGGPNPREGYQVNITVTASGRRLRQAPVYVWTTSETHAASLTCSTLGSDLSVMAQYAVSAKDYKIN